MPLVSRVMVRTALLHLALGSTIGGLLLAEKGLGLLPWLWLLRPSHVHLLLVGWTVQLACGVAVWMLPRLDAAGDRGNLGLVWLCYGALNGGVALAALHAPLAAALGGVPPAWPLVVAGLLYAVAALAAVAHVWRRVLPFGASARGARA
jgi:hypothetical protein